VSGDLMLDWNKVLRFSVIKDNISDVRFAIEIKKVEVNIVDAAQKWVKLHKWGKCELELFF
jgi:hypothetical protein